ncbi:hypothetical protein FHS97_000288 [Sphingomonas endophytica]|uniref:Uncharacterized protein n=1 Tax=Sphingomonas endophytica TaxID=869719 RepID=A0ABR6N0U7_9SPHN|nr:hypothetical protein [Sphingomonas endophytica]
MRRGNATAQPDWIDALLLVSREHLALDRHPAESPAGG